MDEHIRTDTETAGDGAWPGRILSYLAGGPATDDELMEHLAGPFPGDGRTRAGRAWHATAFEIHIALMRLAATEGRIVGIRTRRHTWFMLPADAAALPAEVDYARGYAVRQAIIRGTP